MEQENDDLPEAKYQFAMQVSADLLKRIKKVKSIAHNFTNAKIVEIGVLAIEQDMRKRGELPPLEE